jgi:hypothetical protein
MFMRSLVVVALASLPTFCIPAAHAAAPQCTATSTALPPAVVELYTSEGCSSCPPADRWASALKGRSDVLVLAFHVNYWDRLGWPDRFATDATTERQHRLQRAMATPYVYTPQVVHNGRDLRRWSGAALSRLPSTPVAIALTRDGARVQARVDAPPHTPLAGYWAVLEDGHASRVKSGENAGTTLAHDHVVTLYRPQAAWSTPASGSDTWSLDLGTLPSSAQPRRIAFVVTDSSGARPLQAVALVC